MGFDGLGMVLGIGQQLTTPLVQVMASGEWATDAPASVPSSDCSVWTCLHMVAIRYTICARSQVLHQAHSSIHLHAFTWPLKACSGLHDVLKKQCLCDQGTSLLFVEFQIRTTG